MASILGGTQAVGQNAFGTYNQLKGSLAGNPELVHFIDRKSGATLVQFDCVLNETHSSEAQPTVFPLESGSSITDHVFVTPPELSITAMITDTPLGTQQQLINEGVATALSIIEPPLGVAALGIGYGVFTANKGVLSPSLTAYANLVKLQCGSPATDKLPPIPPEPFDVRTRLKLYRNMVIRTLTVPRDATISNALIFQMSLSQLTRVQPQTVNVEILSNAAMQAAKANEGEQEAQPRDGLRDGYLKSQKDLGFLRK